MSHMDLKRIISVDYAPPPPFEKGGHIALNMSVGMSVSLNLVQLKTQVCFAQEVSNLVGG